MRTRRGKAFPRGRARVSSSPFERGNPATPHAGCAGVFSGTPGAALRRSVSAPRAPFAPAGDACGLCTPAASAETSPERDPSAGSLSARARTRHRRLAVRRSWPTPACATGVRFAPPSRPACRAGRSWDRSSAAGAGSLALVAPLAAKPELAKPDPCGLPHCSTGVRRAALRRERLRSVHASRYCSLRCAPP